MEIFVEKKPLMVTDLMSCRILRMSLNIVGINGLITDRYSFGEPLYMLENLELASQ
jgi:hypothetical protein